MISCCLHTLFACLFAPASPPLYISLLCSTFRLPCTQVSTPAIESASSFRGFATGSGSGPEGVSSRSPDDPAVDEDGLAPAMKMDSLEEEVSFVPLSPLPPGGPQRDARSPSADDEEDGAEPPGELEAPGAPPAAAVTPDLSVSHRSSNEQLDRTAQSDGASSPPPLAIQARRSTTMSDEEDWELAMIKQEVAMLAARSTVAHHTASGSR